MAGVAEMINQEQPANPLTLPFAGQSVAQLCIDYAVTLHLSGGAVLRIEQAFTVGSDGHEDLIDPGGGVALLGPVLRIARSTVERGTAFHDGRLDLTFLNGDYVRVPVDEEYEAWELSTTSGLRVVSGPGSHLTVWSPSDG